MPEKTIILPERKHIRLKGYDYSDYGVYYVTICVRDRMNLFGKLTPLYAPGTDILCGAAIRKTTIAKFVEQTWHKIPEIYPYVLDDSFVIMPDHIHGILIWKDKTFFGFENTKTLSQVIAAFKSITTREYKKLYNSNDTLWQSGFYETILTGEKQYSTAVDYIEHNPYYRLLKNQDAQTNNT